MTTAPAVPPVTTELLGDLETMWVHDASNEKARCCLAEAVAQGNAVTFMPDTVAQAHDDGFDDCPHCLGPDPVPPGDANDR